MATRTEPQGDAIPVNDGPPVPISDANIAAYESMIASVPDAGGDGMDGILAALAMATDAADLDAPWRSAGLEQLIGQRIRITGIRKVRSEYAGGLPWFIVADGAIVETGETIAVTTGAVSVVAQLVKAHQLGAFPLDVIPRQSDRPSKAGYYPQHLQIAR